MKQIALIVATICLLGSSVVTSAQGYLNLGQKRTNLVLSLRNLGPLTPPSWTGFTVPLLAPNYAYTNIDFTYHWMGNYKYVNLGPDPGGQYAYLYDYIFNTSGTWTYSWDSTLNNTSADMPGSFGILLPNVPASGSVNYFFGLPSSVYNIAGLRYLSVYVAYTGTLGGNVFGWAINAGQTVNTTLAFNTAQTFDLGQNLEAPSFAVSDYWFGAFPNYPQDAKVPAPQNTTRQSQNAFFIGSPFRVTTNMAWVQEGVYRPGLTLQPGYTTPRLFTYMQQYFDSAWKADPNTGTVPRTSALNWNGVGKINTNTAVRTGALSGLGYYYTPTQYGKSILTTQPQENGYYGEVPFFALQMLADKNRDGLLNSNDVTSASNPHVFWSNNDCDRSTYSADDLWDEEDIQTNASTVSDAQFVVSKFRIPSLRDLEDYDRLHIRGLNELLHGLSSGQGYTVSLRWKSVSSGNPGIFVFKATETNGGSAYVTDSTTAATQIYPTLYPTNSSEPGLSSLAIGRVESGLSPVLINDSVTSITDFFIYCGTSRGSGELAVSVYRSATLIGEASIYLNIRDVKELYERWTLGDGNEVEPATTPSLVGDGLPIGVSATQFTDSVSSNKSYILFVHGWNMAPFDKDAFSETAFKRLYWQGYTNRFGAFRWPTGYGFQDKLFSYPGPITDPGHYDKSEFIAWKSGEGLRQHILNLNQRYTTNRVYLLAHSMGNVVAGEALALSAEKYHGGQIVNTYIASQAAVSLDCYKTNGSSPVYQIPFQYEHPKQEQLNPYLALWPTYGWLVSALNGPINWDSSTPNIYQGWLEVNRISALRRINFYNPHDYALAMSAWGFNQLLKPDTSLGVVYSYIHFSAPSVPWFGNANPTPPYFLIPSPARSGVPQLTGIRQLPGYFAVDGWFSGRYLNFEFVLNDMYEAMSLAAEARTYPLGRIPDGLGQQIDLRSLWPTDGEPDPDLGVYGRHKWHSGEFRSNNIRQGNYWNFLLTDQGFNLR
jgi:pimeloyl-ACP methyl ester carboxylesterase